MILAACLLALAQGRLDGDDLALVASQPAAHWEVESNHAEVGEPFVATLVVRHDGKGSVALDPAALAADTSWLELSPPRVSAVSAPGESRWNFELASLEPGERDLPTIPLALQRADGTKANVLFQTVTMSFAGALGANEDELRPPREFRSAGEDEARSIWPPIAALAIAGAALGWLVSLRWRRREAPAPPPSPLERLAALEQRDLEASESVRAMHYELTALLREQLDGGPAAARRSLTDDEWLALVSKGLPSDAASELGEILRASREVKYGGARPTHWAVRETLAKAKRVAAAKPAESTP